jgi:hypothetical protein
LFQSLNNPPNNINSYKVTRQGMNMILLHTTLPANLDALLSCVSSFLNLQLGSSSTLLQNVQVSLACGRPH